MTYGLKTNNILRSFNVKSSFDIPPLSWLLFKYLNNN